MAKKKKGAHGTLLLLILLVLFLYWQNNSLEVSKYEIEYGRLPEAFDGFRIVQISDMHGKTFGTINSGLARKIKKLKPDILLVTGDMTSSTINDGGAFLDFLDSFDHACDVYMSLGNHEQIARWLTGENKVVDYESFIYEVQNRGVRILDNEEAKIKRGEDTITLEGLTIELYHYSRRDLEYTDENLFLKKTYIEQAIGKPNKGFNILLAHNPAYFDEYVSWGADLILSGHVHGGVVQVPFKGGLLSPERVFFPKYDAGIFEKEGSLMVVNRGLGYSVINFRLFNRPEISFIELKR